MARVSLDMHGEAFFTQVPDDVSAGWTDTNGGLREHTITWADGSEVVTWWRQRSYLKYIEKVGR